MASEVLVALDQGSASSRALAFDRKGRVVAAARFPVKTFYPRPGVSEHDPLDLARTQEAALDAVLKRLPRRAEVLGLAVACQRSTVVFWDRRTGRPAGRAPSWQDGRAAAVVAPLQDRQRQAHEATGLYLTPYYSAPKIRWCLDHDPKVRALAEAGQLLAAPVASFLLWRLSGGAIFAADPTLAQRMMLFNIKTLAWDPDMLALFGLSQVLLPPLQPSAGAWGVIERLGRRIPVLSVIGDQQAAAIGLGGREDGSCVANYGTGAFFLRNTGERLSPVPGLLASVGWQPPASPPRFFLEGTVHSAGSSLAWLRENLGLLKKESELDAAWRASRERVWALPAIGGLGAPRWDYATKTAFFGLSSKTKAQDLVRGVAEGLAFLVADIAESMRAQGISVGGVKVSGGLSRSACLMQFQSDVLGAPLERCAEPEATARGAASLAAEAAGAADWARTLRRPKIDRVFSPKMTESERQALLGAWRRFVQAQVALSRDLAGAS